MPKSPFVYIMASSNSNVLYIGVTSNLPQRAWQHRESVIDGFSRKYKTKRLVYFESHETMESAVLREKDLKGWNRAWKDRIIEKMNPDWEYLYYKLNQ